MSLKPWDIVFLVCFVAYLGIRHEFGRRVKGQPTTFRQVDRLELTLLVAVMAGSLLLPVLYLFTPWLDFANYELPPIVPWFGLASLLAALWLFWRSHADLGRNWSVSLELRRDHELITHGVYRRIRHPMYTSIWLFVLGQGLMLENWLAGWCGVATFAPLYFIRTPREERMMCDAFGARYRGYMEVTGRLLPRLRAGRP